MWTDGPNGYKYVPPITTAERQSRLHGAEIDALTRIRYLAACGAGIPDNYKIRRINEIITELDNTIKEIEAS